MHQVTVDRLVSLPIDKNVLIGDIGRTVLGPHFLGGLVKVILYDFRTLDGNGSDNPPGETLISNLGHWITLSKNARPSALSDTLSKDRS